MSELTDEDVDAFRKEFKGKFYIPQNYQIFSQIADTPYWLRRIFVWKHKHREKENAALFATRRLK